ncbi:MAG: polysaccharide deacetylase [Myxococcales bacterium]|nr:polysaccharide deacetylase [Myxococcales bacterium]
MSQALASLSIDLDGIRHYRAIHGLPPRSGPDPFLTEGLDRFLELCERFAIPATLFVVTEDLADDDFARRIRKAAKAGHEIASHSHRHDYDFSQHSPAEIQAELHRSREAIRRVTRKLPRGFRAPGYNLSPALVDALAKVGFTYDSSMLPSPLYWAARAAVISGKSLTDRPSASLIGRPNDFIGDGRPHRFDNGLLELPMTGALGIPWIGSLVVTSPLGSLITRTVATRTEPIDLELHPIDLTSSDQVEAELVAVRRDLQVPVARRQRRLEKTLQKLVRNRRFRTLSDVAETCP